MYEIMYPDQYISLVFVFFFQAAWLTQEAEKKKQPHNAYSGTLRPGARATYVYRRWTEIIEKYTGVWPMADS